MTTATNSLNTSCYNLYMAEAKTQKNDSSVEDFLTSVPDQTRRSDSLVLVEIFKKVTKLEPKMWGTAIVGFGEYDYVSEKGTQKGVWPLVAFSPRKQNLTLYVISDNTDLSDLLTKLGKATTSKACLYINKLSDVDLNVLEEIIDRAFKAAKKQYNV